MASFLIKSKQWIVIMKTKHINYCNPTLFKFLHKLRIVNQLVYSTQYSRLILMISKFLRQILQNVPQAPSIFYTVLEKTIWIIFCRTLSWSVIILRSIMQCIYWSPILNNHPKESMLSFDTNPQPNSFDCLWWLTPIKVTKGMSYLFVR